MAKILLITHIYPPAIDGGSQAIANFGSYLQSQGHETLVLTSNCSSTDDFVNPSSKPIPHHQPNVISLPVFKRFHKILKLVPPFHKGPIFKSIPIFRVIKFKPDLIIAGPLPTTIVIYAYLYKLITHSPLLICPCYHPNDSDFNNPILRFILKHSEYLWCLTHYETKLLKHPNTITKGLGVNSDFLIKPSQIKFPQNPNILFIANFAAHKRVEFLIDAYKILRQKYPKLTLTLLGQKTLYFPKISSKITKDIKLILKPTRIQVKQAIDQSTLLCLPSIHESFGIVFIESLARGKPVLGTDTPQTTEVIKMLHGGLTFKKDNLLDLVARLEELILNPQPFGQNGYKFVKQHLTWDKIGEKLCQNLNI